jgi:hypothetical protein
MKMRVPVSVVLAAFSLSVQSQTASKSKPTFEQALIEARSPVVLADGKFSGAGAEVLSAAVAESRFVMLGEDHITHEIPQFAEAVCAMMHPDAYAVEVGPYAARFVNGLLHDPNRLAKMAARNKAYPNNMAFLDMREENDLAANCATASHHSHFELWGLDQEFLGASGTLLEAMAASHPGPKSRAAITAAHAKDRAASAEALSSGDYSKLFLLSSSDADVQALESAIKADGNASTRDILHEFTESRRIYRLNGADGAASNLARAEMLKLHFLANYEALKKLTPAPRILFKFGDNHTGKGFNYTRELNLGNFVAELSAGEQAKSLHMFVLGAKGMHFAMAGFGKPFGQEPFVLAEDPDYKWMVPAVANMLPQKVGQAGTTLTLYDLRKLRYRGLDLSRDWEHVVYSYDLCVVMPEFTVATAIQ